MRQRTAELHLPIYQSGYQASVAALREGNGQKDFDTAWAEGAAVSGPECIVADYRSGPDTMACLARRVPATMPTTATTPITVINRLTSIAGRHATRPPLMT